MPHRAPIALNGTSKYYEMLVLYVRSNFWANEPKDAVLREACETAGGNFVDIGSLSQKQRNYARSERMIVDTGVGSHPGDQGMRAIADAISAAMMK